MISSWVDTFELLGFYCGPFLFIYIVGGFFSTRRYFNESRENRAEWDAWAEYNFDNYKANYPGNVNNGVSCRHCGSHKVNMIVQGAANESETLHQLGWSVSVGPKIRYRSHVCGTCGKELYRTKGV